MSLPILICDDSVMAQKQVARALPDEWDVDVSFAKHGAEALASLQQVQATVLFLDLNMPVMDGYQTLEAIAKSNLQTLVVVISGDIQPDARRRVMELGAFDFIKKPVENEALIATLTRAGFLSATAPASASGKTTASGKKEALTLVASVGELEAYQEISNVAMGQAASLLAQLLDVFVLLPIPKVNLLELGDLRMALQAAKDEDTISAVCQGFIGSGITGEALLLFHESSYQDMAKLMQQEGELTDIAGQELLMDIASVLIGACVKGIAEQLDIHFSQGHPFILGQHIDVSSLLEKNLWRWEKILAVEICYTIKNYNIQCDLLLLFTEDSLPVLRNKVAYLID